MLKKGYTLIELLVTIVFCVVFPVLLGVIGFVAYHFISKAW